MAVILVGGMVEVGNVLKDYLFLLERDCGVPLFIVEG